MGARLHQYLGAFCAALLSFSFGTASGWNAPSFPSLASDEDPALDSGPLTSAEISWIAALHSPGGLIGTFLYGWLLERFSRRFCAVTIGVTQIVFWVLIAAAQSHWYIYASRFLAGLSGAGAYIVGTVFISEIAEVKIRGFLGSMFYLSWNLGIFTEFVVGAFVHCLVVPWIYLPINILAFILLFFLHDSPFYFAKHGKIKEAEASLRFYRGLEESENPPEFLQELSALKDTSQVNAKLKGTDEKLQLRDFTTKAAIKATSIGVALAITNPLSGCFPMLNYTSKIFTEAGSSLPPSYSTMIVGFIQVVSTYVSTLLVERTGRRVLLVTSAVGTCFGQALFGAYFYLSAFMDLSAFSWVPLLSFSIVVFMANLGLLSLLFLLLPEILPTKIRGPISTLCFTLFNSVSFSVLKFLPFVMENLGFHVVFFGFSVVCASGALFYFVLLPETKGKTLKEIQEELSK